MDIVLDSCFAGGTTSTYVSVESDAYLAPYPYYTVAYFATEDDCNAEKTSAIEKTYYMKKIDGFGDCVEGTKMTCSNNEFITTMYSNADCTGSVTGTTTLKSNYQCGSTADDADKDATPMRMYCPSEEASDSSCFAGTESVLLEDGSSKLISEVRVGDRILSADTDGSTGFSNVIALAHPSNNIKSTFVHIETESGSDVKVTPSHLVLASVDCSAAMKLTKASDITMNSCLLTTSGPARVSAVTVMSQNGIYSVIAEKQLIVVNGIVASPFAVNHEVANKYYDMFRFFPAALTFKLLETLHFGFGALIRSVY